MVFLQPVTYTCDILFYFSWRASLELAYPHSIDFYRFTGQILIRCLARGVHLVEIVNVFLAGLVYRVRSLLCSVRVLRHATASWQENRADGDRTHACSKDEGRHTYCLVATRERSIRVELPRFWGVGEEKKTFLYVSLSRSSSGKERKDPWNFFTGFFKTSSHTLTNERE